ncbi:MAG: 16S rRNA (guanine(966)-N(2))-methyltransferase RsmD [Alphaproteobacteria bacterium]|nr:16S rRNA (guanine(966)-N(2))-methyltransferase RsmD [Alphaproteobacteria bacterium]
MRIVAGKYRAKKLIAPENDAIRPTSDRAREALFNILYSKFGSMEGKTVLDIFAGTGALGFEALSRGAASVCFVDVDIQTLQKNARLFALEKEKIRLIKADVSKPLHIGAQFDFVFSDAPYDKGLNEIALQCLEKNGALKDGAICVVETRKNETVRLPQNFVLICERVYGMAKIHICIFHQNV